MRRYHRAAEILDLLKSLAKGGRTVIVVTHDERVAACADRRVTMHDGRISGDTGPATRRSTVPLQRPADMRSLPSFAQVAQIVRTASLSMKRNPLRTGLTLLGVVIGVARRRCGHGDR